MTPPTRPHRPLLACAAALLLMANAHSQPAPSDPTQTPTNPSPSPSRIVLGAGCFWCVEAVYQAVPGVLKVTSGFAGGHVPHPSYKLVTTGTTGHAEVVEILYDPSQVSEEQLINLFWQIHDPTDPTGVWPDFGPMYRSILLAQDPAQLERFTKLRNAAQPRFDRPIATEIKLLDTFYPAEAYHQDFVQNNPGHPYVERIARPKIHKAQKLLQQHPRQQHPN